MKKIFTMFWVAVLFVPFLPLNFAGAEGLSDRLKGRILIQTEKKGEAWYVNPENGHRYYLGRPSSAFNIMSRLGLGISNQDFEKLDTAKLQKLAGRILLKVEDAGRAYYVNPENLEMSFLGRPTDAFAIMKEVGLGISENNLEKILKSSLDLSGFDFTVNPGEDFYDYVNSNWIKNNEIPADKSSLGVFSILSEESYKKLKKIMETDYEDKKKEGSVTQKVLDFYNTGMETEQIKEESLEILNKEFARIDKIENLDDLALEIGYMHKKTATPLFEFYAYADMDNSDMNIAEIWQNGFSLPNKNYYSDEDERSLEIREKYLEFLTKMFALKGEEGPEQKAETIVRIESALAEVSMSRDEYRDPQATNNKMNLTELKAKTPNFNWDLYLQEIGVPEPGIINVAMLDYMSGFDLLLEEISLEDWKTYLKWNLLDANVKYMGKDFFDLNFDFYYKFLNGYKESEERWKTVIGDSNQYIGMLLGELYVKDNFSSEAKTKMLELVDNIRQTYRERIIALDWMSEEAKKEALAKLDSMRVKIGYPDVWPDHSRLEIKNDSYLANIFKVREFAFQKDINDIGKAVDKSIWHMNPQTVNAYYSNSKNEIVFPAGILQALFFNQYADDAMNYGGIGMVIAHEITHGFDDQGRKFDAKGNLRDWWNEEDIKNFEERTEILIEQYNSYSPLPGFFVDGELTQGENIADLGGVTIAFNSFKKTIEDKKIEKIDGFTQEQRFFLSLAQIWRDKATKERKEFLVKNDYHSPAKFRVNGPLSNFTEFSEAFNLDSNAPIMRAEEGRVVIW
jgi:putative endopeptidase